MSNPYIGQVSAFGFPYAPTYWSFCDGKTVPINQQAALYSLIGNLYGGNATSFGLPNLGGAAPCGAGQGTGLTNRQLGQAFGSAAVQLDQTTMPKHLHTAQSVAGMRGMTKTEEPSAASGITVSNKVLLYSDGTASGTMSQNAVSPSGGGLAHNNQQPYLGINYCIALNGQYPYFD